MTASEGLSKMNNRDDVVAFARAIRPAVEELKRKAEREGRPKWTKDEFKEIDKWIKRQKGPALNRTDAVRRLVTLGLKVHVAEYPATQKE